MPSPKNMFFQVMTIVPDRSYILVSQISFLLPSIGCKNIQSTSWHWKLIEFCPLNDWICWMLPAKNTVPCNSTCSRVNACICVSNIISFLMSSMWCKIIIQVISDIDNCSLQASSQVSMGGQGQQESSNINSSSRCRRRSHCQWLFPPLKQHSYISYGYR